MPSEDDTARIADFLAGRLTPDAATSFQARLETDAELAAMTALARGVRDVEAAQDEGPGAFGWARLSRRIDAEAVTVRQSWRVPLWQAAAAVVLGIGLWQAAVVPTFVGEPGLVTASGDSDTAVRVAFRPDAPAGEIAEVLRSLQAEIIAGPSAVGLYLVVPTGGGALPDLAEALSTRDDLVESATLP